MNSCFFLLSTYTFTNRKMPIEASDCSLCNESERNKNEARKDKTVAYFSVYFMVSVLQEKEGSFFENVTNNERNEGGFSQGDTWTDIIV